MLQFKIILVLSVLSFITLIDLYTWQAIKTITKKNFLNKAKRIHFGITIGICFLFISGYLFLGLETNVYYRSYVASFIFIIYLSKFLLCIFLLADDIRRVILWIWKKFNPPASISLEEKKGITRAQFLSQAGAITGAIPFVILSKGIFKGAYDYRIHNVPLYLRNLPLGFEGLKVGQLSDIHTGSLFDKDSVHKGIQMLLAEKPDLIFFTGDLVNNKTDEAYHLMDHLAEVKAPMGVFSIFGNHDYGDYLQWANDAAKARNLADLVTVHKDLGWFLMRNEHVLLEKGGNKIALLGVENWGNRGRFQKFGDIEKAKNGLTDVSVKLLLSHDPSHFDSVISQKHQDIDATFSGHTHGFQFGIEAKGIKWSPSQWIYPHWAGLYQEGKQQLYVNRGFGFLGYPGRVGILPEITIFELRRA
jgi:predicted MPP superfamily phosphohydrolase